MTASVTIEQVNGLLGTGWENGGDADRAVLEANAYLSGLSFKAWEVQPDNVTRAGAELAKLAAAGNLYTDKPGAIKRKSVKAGDVATETEYMDGSAPSLGALSFVDALLKPWLLNAGSVQMLKRL